MKPPAARPYLLENLVYQLHCAGGTGRLMLPATDRQLGPVYWCRCAAAGRTHVIAAVALEAVAWARFDIATRGLAGAIANDPTIRRSKLMAVIARLSVIADDLETVRLHPRFPASVVRVALPPTDTTAMASADPQQKNACGTT